MLQDLDATIVTTHSKKESVAPTLKRTFGFRPLLGFADHGPGGADGEYLAGMLSPGNANANSSADHITVLDQALAQLPVALRSRVSSEPTAEEGRKRS